MSEPVVLMFLQHLFPEWTIARDVHGVWRAAGRILISASSADGLVEMLGAADPDGLERASRVVTG